MPGRRRPARDGGPADRRAPLRPALGRVAHVSGCGLLPMVSRRSAQLSESRAGAPGGAADVRDDRRRRDGRRTRCWRRRSRAPRSTLRPTFSRTAGWPAFTTPSSSRRAASATAPWRSFSSRPRTACGGTSPRRAGSRRSATSRRSGRRLRRSRSSSRARTRSWRPARSGPASSARFPRRSGSCARASCLIQSKRGGASASTSAAS